MPGPVASAYQPAGGALGGVSVDVMTSPGPLTTRWRGSLPISSHGVARRNGPKSHSPHGVSPSALGARSWGRTGRRRVESEQLSQSSVAARFALLERAGDRAAEECREHLDVVQRLLAERRLALPPRGVELAPHAVVDEYGGGDR